MAEFIVIAIEVAEQAEKLKGYWDDTGLDMHIAVKICGTIAVSTKHWTRVHYITPTPTNTVQEIWKNLGTVSDDIGRKFIRSEKGPYVYINKLNEDQTQAVFDKLKEKFGNNVKRVWELSWDIDDAVLP